MTWADEKMQGGTPVTVLFLAQEFGMSSPTVKTRLAGVPIAGKGTHGNPLYRLRDAAPRLMEKQRVSEADIKQAMKTMRPQDLPAMMQAVYWDAMRKRQAWERDAAHLWRTEDVLDVLTDLFRLLRESIRLWADEVDGEKRLPSENLKYLRQRTNDLQAELHKRLEAVAKTRSTPPSSAHLETPDDEPVIVEPEPAPRRRRDILGKRD